MMSGKSTYYRQINHRIQELVHCLIREKNLKTHGNDFETLLNQCFSQTNSIIPYDFVQAGRENKI